MLEFLKAKVQKYFVVRELKRLRKVVLQKGGAAKVCFEYWKFLEKDELFQELGIVAEKNAPYPKMVAILSALDLLNSWKQDSNDDETIHDLMELLSKQVYVSASLSFNHDELAKLREEAGGTAGQFTVRPEGVTAIERVLRTAIAARKDTAVKAWSRWKETDFDIFDAIKNA